MRVVPSSRTRRMPRRSFAGQRPHAGPAQLLVDSRLLRIVADALEHASLRPVVLAQETQGPSGSDGLEGTIAPSVMPGCSASSRRRPRLRRRRSWMACYVCEISTGSLSWSRRKPEGIQPIAGSVPVLGSHRLPDRRCGRPGARDADRRSGRAGCSHRRDGTRHDCARNRYRGEVRRHRGIQPRHPQDHLRYVASQRNSSCLSLGPGGSAVLGQTSRLIDWLRSL